VTAPALPGRLALVVHPTRAIDGALGTLRGWGSEHGVDVVQLEVEGNKHREVAPIAALQDGDLVVAVGGDGTVLSALRASAKAGAPVLGIACGSLGALSAIGADELPGALERVRAGDWTHRSLPALSVRGAGPPEDWAANDVVVVRRGPGQLVAEIAVDGESYARLAGDGVVVATPLGSSAYSMAAGGPVLASDTDAFVCTPLAMHGGNAPPLVVPGDAALTVEVQPSYVGFDVDVDGHRRTFAEERRFEFALHRDKLTLVRFDPPGRGLTGLRRRKLILDSPRVLARDARER
jgi:NAD+ kinase